MKKSFLSAICPVLLPPLVFELFIMTLILAENLLKFKRPEALAIDLEPDRFHDICIVNKVNARLI